jgi:hypothetical protein
VLVVGGKLIACQQASAMRVQLLHKDAAACVAIYRPYVRDTTISWEIEVPTVDEMAARIGAAGSLCLKACSAARNAKSEERQVFLPHVIQI